MEYVSSCTPGIGQDLPTDDREGWHCHCQITLYTAGGWLGSLACLVTCWLLQKPVLTNNLND